MHMESEIQRLSIAHGAAEREVTRLQMELQSIKVLWLQ
jgi:hypothetical protein